MGVYVSQQNARNFPETRAFLHSNVFVLFTVTEGTGANKTQVVSGSCGTSPSSLSSPSSFSSPSSHANSAPAVQGGSEVTLEMSRFN